MSIIEVNHEDLPESEALVLKMEYACHAGDVTEAEICLSGHVATNINHRGYKDLEDSSVCGVRALRSMLVRPRDHEY